MPEPTDLTPGPGMVHLDNGQPIAFAQPSEATKPTDLQRVAQWAKSSNAPSDVYNAACRVLNGDGRRTNQAEAEVERLGKVIAEYQRQIGYLAADASEAETEVKRLQVELADDAIRAAAQGALEIYRTHARAMHPNRIHSPGCLVCQMGLRLSRDMPGRPDSPEAIRQWAQGSPEKGSQSHGDGRTPQTLGMGEGHEAAEAQEASQ